MSDQVVYLATDPPIFQLGLPPDAGVASCTDCCVAMIVRRETKRTVTAEQVRRVSGHTGGDYTGLTPAEALTALDALGVHTYSYHSGVVTNDVINATNSGVVLAGVGYYAYPTVAQAEYGGKTDMGFGGPHAITVWGSRTWKTKPTWWSGPFAPGERFWARDPDHRQGWSAKYDRAVIAYLSHAIQAIVGQGSPPWPTTFMIAKGAPRLALGLTSMEDQPGYNTPIDQSVVGTDNAPEPGPDPQGSPS